MEASTLTLAEAVVLIDSGGMATDSLGNSLAAAKVSQINASSPFGSNDVIELRRTCSALPSSRSS